MWLLGICLASLFSIFVYVSVKLACSPDSLQDSLLSILFEDEGLAAKGFGEWRFKRLPMGVDTNELLYLLGEPLWITNSGTGSRSTWVYMCTIPESSHRIRRVVVQGGIVVGKEHYFYFD